MTRRVLACLFAVAMMLALASPVEARGGWPVWVYHVCNKHHVNIQGDTFVCMNVTAQRQADNQGFNINSVRIYTKTPADSAGGCAHHFYETDPAVVNQRVRITSIPVSGLGVVKWEAFAPNLVPDSDNECSKTYQFAGLPGDVVTTDNGEIHIAFDYKARLNAQPDADSGIGVQVRAVSGGTALTCGQTADECSRSLL